MPHFSSDAEVDDVARGFIDRSLPKAAWTHAGHFAAALWLLRHYGLAAMTEMPPLIRAYNEATGVLNTDRSGYHETITLASLRAAHTWLTDLPDEPLHVVLDRMLATHMGRSDWLLRYWSGRLLFSVVARRTWVDPDLEWFPF
jgi:hypothetical protein